MAKGVPGTQVGCHVEGRIAWFETVIEVPLMTVTLLFANAAVKSTTSCTRLFAALLKVAVTVGLVVVIGCDGGVVVEKLQVRMSWFAS